MRDLGEAMTTTKTLIEAATLTEEEQTALRRPLRFEQVNPLASPYDGYFVAEAAAPKVIATAARDKALWAVVDWLNNLEEQGLPMGEVSSEAWVAFGRGHQWPIVEAMEKMLTANEP